MCVIDKLKYYQLNRVGVMKKSLNIGSADSEPDLQKIDEYELISQPNLTPPSQFSLPHLQTPLNHHN